MRRPRYNAAVVRALGAVRSEASSALDSSDEMERTWQKELERGIRFIDDMRAWYEAEHGPVEP